MVTERKVIYEPIIDEYGKETGEIRERVVRTIKWGNYDLISDGSMLNDVIEFLSKLKDVNEINTYKKLMKEFGFVEEYARGMVRGYVNGAYLELGD